MALSPKLELRQGQSLVMTPQLQQAIKLLQFSAVELAAFVEAELERNPLLERAEAPEEEAFDPPEAEAAFEANDGADLDVAAEDLHPDLSAGDLAEAGAAAPLTDWSKAGNGKSLEDLPDAVDGPSADPITLAQHLEAQMAEAGFSPTERLIGAALIDRLDDWGYVRLDMPDFAAQLGCPAAQIEAVLARMQGFEPTGVMARSLAECLTLQLKERNRFDPAMAALVENLDLLARNNLRALQQACRVDAEDLSDMIAELRSLTPKPGAAFGGVPAQTVTPDVYVLRGPDGGWLVELNSEALPKVLMNARYAAQISKGAKREADKTFISECTANASWLVKSLDQRARTILKVAREIVRQQDGFLAYGVTHLRPLNLKAVADAIGMHESTVSRVTSNKYIATPRGVFELKYFFTAAISSADGGEAHSAEAVRYRIKAMIEAEQDEVLSDDRIVEILREAGIDIARRTVAKYREALRIPSSLERRRRLAR